MPHSDPLRVSYAAVSEVGQKHSATEMAGNEFLHSHSFMFPCSQFPFSIKYYSHSHWIIPIHKHARQNNEV